MEPGGPPGELPESIGPFNIVLRRPARDGELVYEAVHAEVGAPTLIKMIEGPLALDSDRLTRLEEAVAALSQAPHPSIVRPFGVGETEDGRRYLAEELIPGSSLRKLIDDRAPVDLPTALAWMTQAAEALAHAAERGALHLDLKTENQIVGGDERLRVLEFSLAPPLEALFEKDADGKARGSALYASPELCAGGAVDARSDLYSLGASFYHLIVGRAPFEGETLDVMKSRHQRLRPMDAAEAKDGLPAPFAAILNRLLAKGPEARFQTATELVAALEEVLGAIEVAAHPEPPPAPVAAVAAPPPVAEPEEAGDPSLADPSLVEVASPVASSPIDEPIAPPPFVSPFAPPPQAEEEAADPSQYLSVLATSPPPGAPTEQTKRAASYQSGIKVELDEAAPTTSRHAPIIIAVCLVVIAVVGGMIFYQNTHPGASPLDLLRGGSAASAPEASAAPAAPAVADEVFADSNFARMEYVMKDMVSLKIEKGKFPESLTAFEGMNRIPAEQLNDSWGHRYLYDRAAQALQSAGPDGLKGTADDVALDSKFKRLKGKDFPCPEAEQ